MSADFTPSFGVYKETGSFKFWCQKVLPLVYDDSLSYYETLCKVVKYLNDVIANVDVLHDDVDALRTAYTQLQSYVNSYFDNLDVQNEINQKLDDMADDGSLSALLSPIVATQSGGVVGEQIDAVVGSQIDASVGRQIDESVASQIGTPTATATTAWLNEHVNPVGSAVVVDDTLTISGAAADAKVCGDELSRLNNALTYVGVLNSFYGNGDKTYSCTIENGKKYGVIADGQINAIQTKSGSTVVQQVAYTVSANTQKNFTASGDANGIRIYFSGADNHHAYLLNRETGKITQLETAIDALDTEIDGVDAKADTNAENIAFLFDGTRAEATQGQDKSFDFAVTSGTKYFIYNTGKITGLQTRDSENNVVQTIIGASANSGMRIFTASADASKIRFYANVAGYLYISKDNALLPDRFMALNKSYKIMTNKADGKDMCVIGDSLTHGAYTNTKWHDIVSARYNLNSVENLSADGASYTIDGSMSNPRFTEVVKTITGTPDYIVLFGGTNDYSQNRPLGTIADVASDSNGASFYAAVKYTMEYLLDNYPDSVIIYITPLQRNDKATYNVANTQGLYLTDYVNVIRELAEIYGVALCDLFKNSQFHVYDSTWKSTYTYDGLHPNTDGTEYYTKNGIIPTFDKLLLDYDTYNHDIIKE